MGMQFAGGHRPRSPFCLRGNCAGQLRWADAGEDLEHLKTVSDVDKTELIVALLQIDKDEVRLRRTISVKKDEYRLNSKSTP